MYWVPLIGAAEGQLYKWWKAESGDEDSLLLGKPPVQFRKMVNTVNSNGYTIGVNAQQYAVLVMDVPDFRADRRK